MTKPIYFNRNNADEAIIYDEKGRVVNVIISDKSKCFAVVVKCGHCGKGFFIPFMYTTRADNIEQAKQEVCTLTRVKSGNCVLDSFEVSELEKRFIDFINDNDGYKKGTLLENSEEMNNRRVVLNFEQKDLDFIKTADEYDDHLVLERYYAPVRCGEGVRPHQMVKKEEMFHEFFKTATYYYGTRKNNRLMLLLYYLKYGKDNDLYIKCDGKTIKFSRYYKGEFTLFEFDIEKEFKQYSEMFNIQCKPEEYRGEKVTEEKEENTYTSSVKKDLPSQTDKFNARLIKSLKKMDENATTKVKRILPNKPKEQKKPLQPGEEE